jgi:hypothetical protein
MGALSVRVNGSFGDLKAGVFCCGRTDLQIPPPMLYDETSIPYLRKLQVRWNTLRPQRKSTGIIPGRYLYPRLCYADGKVRKCPNVYPEDKPRKLKI